MGRGLITSQDYLLADRCVARRICLQIKVAVPIAVVIAAPALAYLIVALAELAFCCSSCRCAKRGLRAVLGRCLNPLMRAADQIGDWKIGSNAALHPVHWEG